MNTGHGAAHVASGCYAQAQPEKRVRVPGQRRRAVAAVILHRHEPAYLQNDGLPLKRGDRATKGDPQHERGHEGDARLHERVGGHVCVLEEQKSELVVHRVQSRQAGKAENEHGAQLRSRLCDQVRVEEPVCSLWLLTGCFAPEQNYANGQLQRLRRGLRTAGGV